MPKQRPVFHPELGAFFRELRERRKLGQRQAAALAQRRGLSLNQQDLIRFEHGLAKTFGSEKLRAVAALYGEPYEALVVRTVEAQYGTSLDRLVGVVPGAQTTTVPGFVPVRWLAAPIAAGRPLVIEFDPERDRTLAFQDRFVAHYVDPVCLQVGKDERSMMPTIQPRDIIVIDQRMESRTSPRAGKIFAVNFAPLTGDPGGAVKRIELDKGHLIVSSDNPDKNMYATQVFEIDNVNLLDVLKGEVVWVGRYIDSGKFK